MKPVAIQMAVANADDSVDTAAVYAFIEDEADGIETYVPAPPPPGMSRKGAVDFALVLSAAGSIASIASLADLIWRAYEKFIAPSKDDPNDDAGIYSVIQTDEAPSNSGLANSTVTASISLNSSRRALKSFDTASVEIIRRGERDGKETDRVMAEVKFSGDWVRRK